MLAVAPCEHLQTDQLGLTIVSTRKSNRILKFVLKSNEDACRSNSFLFVLSLAGNYKSFTFHNFSTMKNLLFSFCCILVPSVLFCQTTVTRSLPAFDKVGISGGYDAVILKEGSTESVSLEVSGIDPEKIITEVKNSTLHIKTKNGSWSNFKARITITYVNIKELANSGSTDIEALNVIKADKFELATSGSGNFKGSFDVKDLDVAISGSCDMTLSGKAENQDIAISGSGDVNASKLMGSSADVAISGSADVKLGVKGSIKTAVSGSGTVSNN